MKAWYEAIWDTEGNGSARIKESERREMLSWLSQRSGFTHDEISRRLGHQLEAMFSDFEEEYGSVKVEDLKAQYMSHVCIQEDSQNSIDSVPRDGVD